MTPAINWGNSQDTPRRALDTEKPQVYALLTSEWIAFSSCNKTRSLNTDLVFIPCSGLFQGNIFNEKKMHIPTKKGTKIVEKMDSNKRIAMKSKGQSKDHCSLP